MSSEKHSLGHGVDRHKKTGYYKLKSMILNPFFSIKILWKWGQSYSLLSREKQKRT